MPSVMPPSPVSPARVNLNILLRRGRGTLDHFVAADADLGVNLVFGKSLDVVRRLIKLRKCLQFNGDCNGGGL
jgi:hypothetical protein